MRLVKQLAVVGLAAFLGSLAVNAVDGNPGLTLVLGVAAAVLAIVAYRWIVRRTERREVGELSRPGAVRATGLGALLGIGLFAAVIGVIALLGGYTVDGRGPVGGAVTALGFMAAAATTEELIFRGVLFRIVEERLGTWGALLLTGLLFGLMHLANPDASLWGALAIAVEAGGMLGAAYVATRRLWLPIGLHFGWNFAEAGIFGTVVSGTGEKEGLLDGTMSGSMLLTGGDFGPEASLAAVVAGLVMTAAFLTLARRRGHLTPVRRRARVAG
ncbi:type II CAAX endopeptidase family protein [Virgisporangium ochraceum]|uniref:CAAX amino protease n=1 Tax=Virgisporangium ochraceum TaxID=65505 RepID=A0A8J3ZMF7_9ACTN|nr:CPBP family intramembrane glutamic endopeptidase [Virgisporangium ochraceum]GIJ66737.1 CAAX amino protease [Virgisporangium ochraceum]